MEWQDEIIMTTPGDDTMKVSAQVKRGLALIELKVYDDRQIFWMVLHMRSRRALGYLFCAADQVERIANELANFRDWTRFSNLEDVDDKAKRMVAQFKSRHLFLDRLPKGLTEIYVRCLEGAEDAENVAPSIRHSGRGDLKVRAVLPVLASAL